MNKILLNSLLLALNILAWLFIVAMIIGACATCAGALGASDSITVGW